MATGMLTTCLVDCEAATPHSHQPVTAEVVSLAGQEGSAAIRALHSHVVDRLSNSLNMEADMQKENLAPFIFPLLQLNT